MCSRIIEDEAGILAQETEAFPERLVYSVRVQYFTVLQSQRGVDRIELAMDGEDYVGLQSAA